MYPGRPAHPSTQQEEGILDIPGGETCPFRCPLLISYTLKSAIFYSGNRALNTLIGIGLRQPHYQQVLQERPPIGWLEVHSENFFQAGGPALTLLQEIRELYPISLHGVGLSLGSATGLHQEHLQRLKKLLDFTRPFLLSEHLSWSRINGIYCPDLLPIPYTDESLNIFIENVNIAQDFLNHEILIENPSSYIEYQKSHLEEVDFLITLCQKTGAKLLLDVNNIYVSCSNHQWNAQSYIDAIPSHLIQEIHLAGHSLNEIAPDQTLKIDTHDNKVCDEVWELYAYTLKKCGPKYTLLEWDSDIPALNVLINEAEKSLGYFPMETL